MAQPFQFIHYAPNLRVDDLLSTHVARSHTAKVNRRNRAKRNRSGFISGAESPKPLRSIWHISDDAENFESCASTWNCGESSVDDSVGSNDGSSQPNFSPSAPPQHLSPTISPVFGGQTVHAFDIAKSGPEVAEVANYVFSGVFSSCFSGDERAAWFEKFSQYPVVHHAFSYFRLFHQERIEGTLAVSQRRRMLNESLHTFQLLNSKLGSLNTEDVEPVMLAMTLMFKDRENLGKENPSENQRLLFSPHMLQNELAGLDIGRVRQTEGYLPAVSLLANQAGGLSNVQDSGLARIMCMSDLISASMNFTAPYFQCGWAIDPAILVPGRYLQLPPGVGSAGEGFQCVTGGLPRLGAFMNLSAVDLAMAQHRQQSLVGAAFKALVYARNAAKHEVLSLPSWDTLSDTERCGRRRTLYECARLAAVLYANAVVFPTLANFAGIQEPMRQLRELLDVCDLGEWEEGVSELFLWSVFVGGISAYRSSHWSTYISTLRKCINTMPNPSSQAIKATLRKFVWSDIACDEGATILWNASRLYDASPRVEGF